MRNPESVLENRTHKILLDSKIQTDYLILALLPDFVRGKKKKKN